MNRNFYMFNKAGECLDHYKPKMGKMDKRTREVIQSDIDNFDFRTQSEINTYYNDVFYTDKYSFEKPNHGKLCKACGRVFRAKSNRQMFCPTHSRMNADHNRRASARKSYWNHEFHDDVAEAVLPANVSYKVVSESSDDDDDNDKYYYDLDERILDENTSLENFTIDDTDDNAYDVNHRGDFENAHITRYGDESWKFYADKLHTYTRNFLDGKYDKRISKATTEVDPNSYGSSNSS